VAALTGLVLSKPSVGYRNYFGQSSLRNLKFSCLPLLSLPFYRDPGGSAGLTIGSTDLGRGSKTVLGQMAVKELGIRYDQINVLNEAADAPPFCLGSFAGRVTLISGNAVGSAAKELEAAAQDPVPAEGKIYVIGSPDKSVANADLAGKSPLIVGRGTNVPAPAALDLKTGAGSAFHTLAWGVVLAEVEEDTETGEVELVRLVCSLDAGKAINPQLVEGQIDGGAGMSQGQAMMEQWQPYHPSLDWQPPNLRDYMIPTTVDVPDIDSVI